MFANQRGRFSISIGIGLLEILYAASSTIAADKPKTPQQWALLIGVNDYANVQRLQYCVADQESLAKQLICSGFPRDQIYLLDDRAEKQKFRPSKLNIEKQLELVLAMPSAGDTVVLGFSGHGVQIAGKSYLCPADCDLEHPQDTMIALEKVFELLSTCNASLKLMIVDACRNNIEVGGKRTLDGARSSQAFSESLERPPEGISLLTSCSPGQFAREHDKLGHGVFMHFVLDGLSGKAADEDGVVRLGGLLDYTSLSTQKYVHDEFNARQRPYYRLEGSGPVELGRIGLNPNTAWKGEINNDGAILSTTIFINQRDNERIQGEIHFLVNHEIGKLTYVGTVNGNKAQWTTDKKDGPVTYPGYYKASLEGRTLSGRWEVPSAKQQGTFTVKFAN